MKKYDIIYDKDTGNARWVTEHSYKIWDILFGFCKEFAEDFNKKPEIVKLVLSMDVWNCLTIHPTYNNYSKSIQIYDLNVEMSADWTVNTNYIELTLS